MATHVVSYDLSDPGRNYKKVIEAIKAFPGRCHALESVWIIDSTLTAAKIRDQLKSAFDKNDKLMVATMSGNWATLNVGKEQTDWLHNAA